MAKAQAYWDKLTIPTYEMLPDDLNPIMDRYLDPYPYADQNHFSRVRKDVEHDVVIVENDYLKVTVLPGIGGRLYSAYDKRNNQEMFYKNEVIKPRLIGTRGAWVSGGIEFNFPISHSPNTHSRVNCTVHHYDDGSASVIFGNIEQMSQMNWKVELRLYPDKAYIEQNVSLYNPTPHENRYYFWTNAAVEYNESVKLLYPFDWGINNLDKNYVKWPYYKGVDCHDSSAIAASFETFGKLMKHNYFGIYNYQKDFGVVHFANRKKLKGAKFFTWGTDDRAASWNRALTDDDSQYIEIQSGPFESQAVYKFMRPHQRLEWSEYWYPVAKLNGFQYAEKDLAVNVEKRESGLAFTFAAAANLGDCKVVLKAGGKEYTANAVLTPDANATVSFELPAEIDRNDYVLDVYSGTEHVLNMGGRSEYTTEYPDHHVYEDSRVVRKPESDFSLLDKAQHQESIGFDAEATKLYLQNLEQHPTCETTLTRLGNLYLKGLQLDKAEECFLKALKYNNRNGQARFLLAGVEKARGNYERARRIYMDIAADSAYYNASVVEMIKLDLRFGYYHEVQMLLDTADFADSYLDFLQLVKNRKAPGGSTRPAAFRPLGVSELILAERYLASGSSEDRDQLLAFTGGEEAVLLSIAQEYMDMGFFADAEKVLALVQQPSMKTKLAEVLIQQEKGQFDPAALRAALEQPLDYVFPNEPMLVTLLESRQDLDDTGKIDYLLGTFYYSVNRKDEALARYLDAYAKGLRYTVLLRNLGYIYLQVHGDLNEAEKYLQEDIAVNGSRNEHTLMLLDRIYRERGDLQKRLELVPHMENTPNRARVLINLAEIYRDAGQYDQAMHILENDEFENGEGTERSGPCYRSIIIHRALSELENGNAAAARSWIDRVDQYPPNLNYGESAAEPKAEVYYYKGLVYARTGDEEQAIRFFRKGVDELGNDWIYKSAASREYSLKCLAELEKRNLF